MEKKTTTTKRTASKRTEKADTTASKRKAEVKEAEPKEVKTVETNTADLEALIKEQAAMIAQLKEQIAANAQNVPGTDNREKVIFLWQAPVADYNVVEFGERGRFGRIIGKTGSIMIPKSELSQIMDTPIRYYMDKRWLVVLSGLDENEREMFGINYKEGEYLSKEAFMDVVGTGEAILDIYPKLCDSHKDIVAKFYYEAWKEGKDIKRDTVVALNKLNKNEAFKQIIEEMNEKDASE